MGAFIIRIGVNVDKGQRDTLKIAVGITMLVLQLAGAASATTHTICFSGCEFTSIQAAINDVNTLDGDTIEVHSGTYYENMNVNKHLALVGMNTGGGKPVVDASGSGSPMTLSADGITVDSFVTINTSNVWCNAGIRVVSSNNTLRDNNVLDGCNGIELSNSYNNTLNNNTVNSKNYSGIYLYNSNDNTLIGNNASNNKGDYAYGINLYNSDNNTLIGNNASNNTEGVYWNFGISLGYSNYNNLSGNIVNFNANGGISFWGFNSNNTLSNNIANFNNQTGIALGPGSNNNTLTNNTANYNNGSGLTIWNFSNYNVLTQNTANYNNGSGISMWNFSNYNLLDTNTVNSNNDSGLSLRENSSYNNITSNIVNSNIAGIRITSSYNNTIINNTANSNDRHGINLRSSHNNTLINNTADSNIIDGISLTASNNNTLTGNTANWNNEAGMTLNSSSSNIIYNNYFNNTNNSVFKGTTYSNYWNITTSFGVNIVGAHWIGGNFWAYPNGTGHSQICTDADWDGICDSVNVLDANNIDYLPLSMNFSALGVHNINQGTNYSVIQTTIDDANPGEKIHVDSGTYYETVNVNKTIILRGVDIGGGKPIVNASGNGNAIVLSADGITIDGFVPIKSISDLIFVRSNNSIYEV